MNLLLIVLLGFVGVIALVIGSLFAFTALNTRRAERLVPADGQFAVVTGGRLHYTDKGSGPAILFIHGLGGQLRNFPQPLIARLSRSHRVIAVDRPGSGHSTFSGRYPDIRTQARMIAQFLDGLDAGPVILAGHSLGGAVSLAIAIDRPDLVSSLTLLAPLTHAIEEAPGAFRILGIRSALLRWLIGWTVVAPVGRFGGKTGGKTGRMPAFAPDPMPDDFESRGGGALLFRPQGFNAASRDMQDVAVVLPSLMARYREIRLPIAILFATGDKILDPGLHGAGLTKLAPLATLTLVPGGHMVPFTRPDVTADWIEATVARLSARSAHMGNSNDA